MGEKPQTQTGFGSQQKTEPVNFGHLEKILSPQQVNQVSQHLDLLEKHDEFSYSHSTRVGKIAYELGQRFGLNETDAQSMAYVIGDLIGRETVPYDIEE